MLVSLSVYMMMAATPTPSPQRLSHRHHVVKPLWPALFLFARLLRSSLSLRFARLLHPFVLAHVVFTRFSALFQVGLKEAGGERKRRTKRAAAAAVVNFFAGCFIAAPALPTIFITCSALAEPPMKMSVCMPRRLAAAGVCVCVRGAPLGKKGNL